MDERLARWRMIAGRGLEETLPKPNWSEAWAQADRALGYLFNDGEKGQGGLQDSAPYIATWLGEIRSLFPASTVAFLQKEAIERRGWRQLLTEPETLRSLERNVDLAATLLALKDLVPEQAKAAVREVVADVVDGLRRKFEITVRQAVIGALTRRTHSPIPSARGLDFHTTIRRNLRHYQPELGTIVPERVYFWGNEVREAQWHVIVLVDQSGSMASSVVYSGVIGAIFASLPMLRTDLIFFDTAIVDMTGHLDDPVDVLFGIQLGGGTDINQAVAYAQTKVTEPERTLLILITDLYEGGNEAGMLARLDDLQQSKVKVLCLLALNDRGTASYSITTAQKVADLDIPTFGCTPDHLIELVEKTLSGSSM